MNLTREQQQKWESLPHAFEESLCQVLWKMKQPTAQQLREVGRNLELLWPLLAKERGRISEKQKHYSLDARSALAYAAYYMPANILKFPLILEEMRGLGLLIAENSRWLDVGCGPGTAVFGAAMLYPQLTYWGVDQSPAFLRIAGELSFSLGIKAHWQNKKLGDVSIKDLLEMDPQVVSASNSLSEWGSDVSRRQVFLNCLVDELYERSERDGKVRWILLVEPGSMSASRELLQVRDEWRLLEGKSNKNKLQILLPCLSHRVCGALSDPKDWCHESALFESPEWHSLLGEAAGLKKDQMLFSYLVCAVAPQEILERTVPPQWPRSGSRIVSQIMNEKGLSKCFVCTENGKVMRRVLNSKRTPENEAFFESNRGQVFKKIDADEKGNILRLE